ncbi:hypothetical protein Bbelb_111940 [Branchiostoma belcheri]|nr:hypothetical protein Bbelb_111940 [Branchiostoma belcheri]
MATTAPKGDDRSEKRRRPFGKATTVYETEICVAEGLKVRFRVDLVRHPFTPTRCLVPAGGPLCHSRGAGRIGLLSPRLASTRHRGSLKKYDPRCLVEASRGDRHHCRRIAYGRPGARYRAGDQCMHDDLQGPQRRIDDPVSSAVFSAVDRTILSIATGFGRFEAIAK